MNIHEESTDCQTVHSQRISQSFLENRKPAALEEKETILLPLNRAAAAPLSAPCY